GLTALLVSMHPLATAALSLPVLGIRLNTRQWLGLACGAAGAALVLGSGLHNHGVAGEAAGWPLAGLIWCVISLLGISSSTLWQKRASGRMGLVEGLLFQYLGA